MQTQKTLRHETEKVGIHLQVSESNAIVNLQFPPGRDKCTNGKVKGYWAGLDPSSGSEGMSPGTLLTSMVDGQYVPGNRTNSACLDASIHTTQVQERHVQSHSRTVPLL